MEEIEGRVIEIKTADYGYNITIRVYGLKDFEAMGKNVIIKEDKIE